MSEPINPDPSPKTKFLTNTKIVHDHNEMVQSEQFDLSCDIALMEYQRTLAAYIQSQSDLNLNLAAVAQLKQMGAMEFISIIKRLGLVYTPPAPVKTADNLKH